NHSGRSRYSPARSSRVAWRQGPQGSKQHLALAAPATRTRPQRPRKYLAIHAAELVVEPNFQILRRYRRPLLLRLEHTHRPALEDHVHRPTRLGSSRSLKLRIGITPPSASPQDRSSVMYELLIGTYRSRRFQQQRTWRWRASQFMRSRHSHRRCLAIRLPAV